MVRRNAYKITIDDRERAVTRYIEGCSDQEKSLLSVTRLYRGDYAIVSEKLVYAIFERKTYADYAASIRDGRSENKNKMIEIGCRTYYIIEGPTPAPGTVLSGISVETIAASIERLIFFNNIHVIYTVSAAATLRRLLDIVSAINRHPDRSVADVTPQLLGEELENNESDDAAVSGGDATMLTTPPIEIPEETLLRIWSSIPKIGRITATELIKKFTLRQLVLGEITYDDMNKDWTGRSLTRAQQNSILMGNSLAALSAIPRMDSAIAQTIAESLPQSLASLEALAGTHLRGKGQIVGRKRAERIWGILNYSLV